MDKEAFALMLAQLNADLATCFQAISEEFRDAVYLPANRVEQLAKDGVEALYLLSWWWEHGVRNALPAGEQWLQVNNLLERYR